MADGQILFEFATEGEGAVSQAVVDLKAKSLQAAEAATRMATELRKIKDAGTLSAQGVQALERELAQAQIQAQRFAQEARQAAAGAQQIGAAAAGASRGMGSMQGGGAELVNMVTEMALGFGGLSPQIREFTVTLAGAGNNVSQLQRVLPGPYAILVGLGASVLPLLITKIVEWTSETDEASDANRDLGNSARFAAQQTRELIEAMEERERVSRLASGTATAEELGQEIDNKRAARSAAQADLDAAIIEERAADRRRQNLEGTVEEWRAAQAEVERLRGNVRQLQAAEERLTAQQSQRLLQVELPSSRADLDAEVEADELAGGGRRRRRSGESEREREERAAADNLVRQKREYYEEVDRLRREDLRAEREAREATVRVNREIDAEIRREEAARARALEQEHRRQEREAAEILRDKKREARQASEQIRQEAQAILQPAIQGITGAITEVIKGSKSADEAFQGLLASFLEMISQQAALEAAKNFAAAIADFASQNYGGGALHLAAGVAWTGVAVAAGAASVAVAPAAAATPASPQQSQPQAQQGASSLTFNVNGTIITAGDRKSGRFLGKELGRLVELGARA